MFINVTFLPPSQPRLRWKIWKLSLSLSRPNFLAVKLPFITLSALSLSRGKNCIQLSEEEDPVLGGKVLRHRGNAFPENMNLSVKLLKRCKKKKQGQKKMTRTFFSFSADSVQQQQQQQLFLLPKFVFSCPFLTVDTPVSLFFLLTIVSLFCKHSVKLRQQQELN